MLAQWATDGLNGPYTIRLDAGTDAMIDVPVNIIQEPTASISAPAPGETVKLATTIMEQSLTRLVGFPASSTWRWNFSATTRDTWNCLRA